MRAKVHLSIICSTIGYELPTSKKIPIPKQTIFKIEPVRNRVRQICPTSSKVHTTRDTTKAIHVRHNQQLILFDTPGLVSDAEMRKHHLESSFSSSQRHSIQHADLIGIVHDVSNTWSRGELHATVLHTLRSYPTVPSFLVLNKIDTLKSKRVLLDLARTLTMNTLDGKVGGGKAGATPPVAPRKRAKEVVVASDVPEPNALADADVKVRKSPVGWPGFSEVFMISSVTGDGMGAVMVRSRTCLS